MANRVPIIFQYFSQFSSMEKANVTERTAVYRWVIGFLTGIGRDSFIDSLLLGRIGKLVQYKKLVQYTLMEIINC